MFPGKFQKLPGTDAMQAPRVKCLQEIKNHNSEVENDLVASLVATIEHPLRRTLQLWGILFSFFHIICPPLLSSLRKIRNQKPQIKNEIYSSNYQFDTVNDQFDTLNYHFYSSNYQIDMYNYQIDTYNYQIDTCNYQIDTPDDKLYS